VRASEVRGSVFWMTVRVDAKGLELTGIDGSTAEAAALASAVTEAVIVGSALEVVLGEVPEYCGTGTAAADRARAASDRRLDMEGIL